VNNGRANIGSDLRVEQAWMQGLTGCNVTVTIVDDGKSLTSCVITGIYIICTFCFFRS
jgi:hypothetical protein